MDSFEKAREALHKIEKARQAETAARRELAAALAELGLHLQPGQAAFLERDLPGQVASPGASGDNRVHSTQGASSLDDLDLPSELEYPVAGEQLDKRDPWAALMEPGSDDLEGEDADPFPLSE
jgi:hypothetical protein